MPSFVIVPELKHGKITETRGYLKLSKSHVFNAIRNMDSLKTLRRDTTNRNAPNSTSIGGDTLPTSIMSATPVQQII